MSGPVFVQPPLESPARLYRFVSCFWSFLLFLHVLLLAARNMLGTPEWLVKCFQYQLI